MELHRTNLSEELQDVDISRPFERVERRVVRPFARTPGGERFDCLFYRIKGEVHGSFAFLLLLLFHLPLSTAQHLFVKVHGILFDFGRCVGEKRFNVVARRRESAHWNGPSTVEK